MNRLIRNTLVTLAFVLVGTLFIACDDAAEPQSQSSNVAANEAAAEPLPAGLILVKSPDGAQEITAVKKTAKAGDTVTLRGRVGGSEKPLAENRALVTLIDMTLPTCEKSPMETCPTPWDACCEPSEEIAAKSAT